MRAVAKYGALATLGSLVLSTLSAAPAGGADFAGTSSEARGTVVAAKRAAAAGITFRACPKAEMLPAPSPAARSRCRSTTPGRTVSGSNSPSAG